MYRQRSLAMFATFAMCAALWLATIAVGVTMIMQRGETSGLGVVEDLLRALSSTATISTAVFYAARPLARSRFEYGYLAGQRDSRPTRVTSIASHQTSEKIPVQDRYGSNKLG